MKRRMEAHCAIERLRELAAEARARGYTALEHQALAELALLGAHRKSRWSFPSLFLGWLRLIAKLLIPQWLASKWVRKFRVVT